VVVIVHAPGFKPMLLELLDENHLLAASYDAADLDDEAKASTSVAHKHTLQNYVTCLSRICDRLFTKHNILVTSVVTDNCASISGAVEKIAFTHNFGVINGRCVCHGVNILVSVLFKHHKLGFIRQFFLVSWFGLVWLVGWSGWLVRVHLTR
jgi:hypothetical protein